MTPTAEAYRSSRGSRIYRLPLELFPGFQGFAHLVFANEMIALVDVGSGFESSNEHLQAGLESVRRDHGENVDWHRLTHVIVTHGHIDHFGGLPFVRSHTGARAAVHELDFRVLTNYEQRLAVVAHRLGQFLAEAGVAPEGQESLMSLYLLNKQLFSSVEVDVSLQGAEGLLGPLHWLHVPGHCPGHIAMRVDDLVIVGDHILQEISPHQSPERLSHCTGLGHYLASLDRTLAWAKGVRLGLSGHQSPVEDLIGRVEAIRALHASRLHRVLDLFGEVHTIAEVSQALFPGAEGYHALLAIEEAGAHVEYLEQRGYLEIENLRDLQAGEPLPIRYRQFKNLPSSRLIPSQPDRAPVRNRIAPS